MWPIAFVERDICQPRVDFDPLKYHVWVPLYTNLFFSPNSLFHLSLKGLLCWLSSQRELLVLEDCLLNIAKDTTDLRVEWSHQINLFLGHITITSCCTNIGQNSAQLQNLKHMSASTYWPNSSFKTSNKLQPPNLDQTLCSKPEQKFSFKTRPNLRVNNSTKL